MAMNLPAGVTFFVDANIFVYHFVELGDLSAACRGFLAGIVDRRIDAASTGACLADAVHRVMAIEAQERFQLPGGATRWLQAHPDRIGELSAFRAAASQLKELPLRLLVPDALAIADAAELSAKHGLLTNDAILVTLMRRNDLQHLVTNDDDFDRVPGLTVWKPR
jgi:predicted nucleic acid-binding protein